MITHMINPKRYILSIWTKTFFFFRSCCWFDFVLTTNSCVCVVRVMHVIHMLVFVCKMWDVRVDDVIDTCGRVNRHNFYTRKIHHTKRNEKMVGIAEEWNEEITQRNHQQQQQQHSRQCSPIDFSTDRTCLYHIIFITIHSPFANIMLLHHRTVRYHSRGQCNALQSVRTNEKCLITNETTEKQNNKNQQQKRISNFENDSTTKCL